MAFLLLPAEMPDFLRTFIARAAIMQSYAHLEPLDEDELAFVQHRYHQESKDYLFAMNWLLKVAVAIPFFVGILYYIRYRDTHLMLNAFLIALLSTLAISVVAGFASYMRNLYYLHRDSREKTKVVESVYVTEKKYMALNNTWHFYISSPVKISIEVSPEDFQRFAINDEINIEYSRYARIYFGYH